MKPSDFIELLENPDAPAIRKHDEGGELLLVMLAHMYYADGIIEDTELIQLSRLAGNPPDVAAYMSELRSRPLDIERLAAIYPDPKDRADVLTLAEHAVWSDNDVHNAEWDILDALVKGLDIKRK